MHRLRAAVAGRKEGEEAKCLLHCACFDASTGHCSALYIAYSSCDRRISAGAAESCSHDSLSTAAAPFVSAPLPLILRRLPAHLQPCQVARSRLGQAASHPLTRRHQRASRRPHTVCTSHPACVPALAAQYRQDVQPGDDGVSLQFGLLWHLLLPFRGGCSPPHLELVPSPACPLPPSCLLCCRMAQDMMSKMTPEQVGINGIVSGNATC